MVIRTSIIGPEIHKNASLIAWAQSQSGRRVNGFRTHLWNGITTKQYANICSQIIDSDIYENGLSHVHSDTVSKYQLLSLINERYNLNLDIVPTDPPDVVDRSLATIRPLMSKLTIQPLRDQIMAL